ncbi:hypothetical protein E1301_Tti024068 [Triplophysa tibetana]|uniref:Uncharacterized protein n=1 Tax=Triplophysa tibetana TaxID=1572043 RepID=A0A5A9MS79_9TELE|nr:hypothetical protein E1301_Tti024068 [Triplophysa tibetana]
MASPAKLRKEGEDVVEGFIHNVSPRRQSKNNSPYFTAVLQSARQSYHRLVIFSMEQQATFTQAEKNGNAVRLRNVRRSISFADPDGFDVLCSRGTKVDVTTLPFLRSTPASCRRMTVAEVKALGPKQKVGEVRGQVRLGGAASRVVQVNQADCELREVRISDGTGEVKVTLWDSFVGQVEEGLSYGFTNLSTRDREGCISLCTGPTSSIEEIADLEVPEEGGGEQHDTSTALFSATVKGIEVRIVRKCSSCRFAQRQFLERSVTHRCEGCRLKQGALSFCPSFAGKAVVSTAGGEHSVTLTSSALSSYLRSAGLGGIFNDADAIEDHFLQSAVFDFKVSVDGFLESIHPADERGTSGTGELWDADETEDALSAKEDQAGQGGTAAAGPVA